MAYTMKILWEEREATSKGYNVPYLSDGTDDPKIAVTVGPVNGAFVLLSDNQMYRVADKRAEPLIHGQACKLIVEYRIPESNGQDPNNPTGLYESFDTSAQTEHISKALEDQTKLTPSGGGESPDVGRLIGVTGDGKVEGVDIYQPSYTFSFLRNVPADQMTVAYKNILYTHTGKVNDDAWYMFKEGECLFLGATGSPQYNQDRKQWEYNLTYKFAGRPTENVAVDGFKRDNIKQGWQYLWLMIEEREVDNKLVTKIKGAYIADVYAKADFTQLGLAVATTATGS